MSVSNGVTNPTKTPTENVVATNGSLVHVNMTTITKLSATNYIMWRRQVHALFDGYELATYLDLSKPVPNPLITLPGATTTTENPAHTLYKRQDKLLYSAILGAISLSIQPILSKTTTTSEIWETLAATYAKPSRGHIKQLKYQIKQWKKGTKTIDEYLLGLTTRFDQLVLLGKVIDLEDQIEFVLEGIPEEYKTLIDQVEGRDSPPSLTELHEKLINHEVKIVTAEPASHMPVSANVATNRFIPNNNKSNPRNQPWQSNQRQNTDTNNSTWQPRPYLGKCQICGVQGHSGVPTTLASTYRSPSWSHTMATKSQLCRKWLANPTKLASGLRRHTPHHFRPSQPCSPSAIHMRRKSHCR
ncbi:unnamed protein product [Microthlaspi erraticum]|uniref:Retrotransposon Copia-like N-terminal domain-containing protein n=1 Tax=Microthlaspi erraticum TaxID=1685480 RepID=A0A6D2L0D0_9BRAS|nr:unnamed protein product [Microthlaspi erraticum]CAA7059019.1 unnamed protein product [Microthlaspi erraticum]